MAWALEKKKQNKEVEENCPDIQYIMEDETTEWEINSINKWTEKALRIVRKELNNKFEEGIRLHGMTVDHLVRGHKGSIKNPSLTAKQLMEKRRDLTVKQACETITRQAWYYSLERFLYERKGQVLYYGKLATNEASVDQHLARVDPRQRSLSVGASRSARATEFEEHKTQRKQSTIVRSYSAVRVNTKPGVISLK